MPEMDGPEVAIRVLADIGHTKVEPPHICCMTAYTEKSYEDIALAAGMKDLLTKPVSQN